MALLAEKVLCQNPHVLGDGGAVELYGARAPATLHLRRRIEAQQFLDSPVHQARCLRQLAALVAASMLDRKQILKSGSIAPAEALRYE